MDPVAAAETLRAKLLLLAAVALAIGLALHGDFLAMRRVFCHDSLVAMCSMHLLLGALLDGRLPLWSPEMNAGHPLWPVAETMPGFDPVALAAWPLCRLLGASPLAAFQWTAVVWLFAFALGGAVCSRLALRNWWVNLAVFSLLFGGPVAWAIPLQTQGFLIPFRYSPWVLYALLRLLRSPGARAAAVFGSALAVSAAGYQTNYALYFYGCVFVCHWAVRGTAAYPWRRLWWSGGLALALALLGALPTLVAGLKLLSLFPLARQFAPWGFFYPLEVFWHNLWHFEDDSQHGSAAFGWLGLALILLGAARSAGWLARRWLGRADRVLDDAAFYPAVWLLALLPLGALCFAPDARLFHALGGPRPILGLRNWGFLLTAVLFCLVMQLPAGFEALRRRLPAASVGALSVLTLALILAQSLALAPTHRNGLLYVPALAGRMPPLRRPAPLAFLERRPWTLAWRRYVPFHYEGPALQWRPAAFYPPTTGLAPGPANPLLITQMTHQVRLPRYQLLTATSPEPVARAVLGSSLPVARVVRRCAAARGPDEAARLLSSRPAGALEDWAVVEGLGAAPCAEAARSRPTEPQAAEYTPTSLDLRLRGAGPGVLVWSDNFDEDWRVLVDGRPRPLGVADLTLKAVRLTGGETDVRFEYRPIRYVLAFWIRALFYLAWLAYGAGLALRAILRATERLRPAATSPRSGNPRP